MKNWIFFFVFTTLTFSVTAQNNYLNGTVKDKSNSIPLPYCSILVFQGDSMNSFAITDEQGHFEIPINSGKFKLIIKFLGYISDTSFIEMDNENISIGTIYLKENIKRLNEVIIKSSTRQSSIDKDEIIITDKLRAGAATTIDVLGKIEGISYNKFNKTLKVDHEKNVLLLVNGLRKSAKYIKNINPNRISKIEIMRDPSGIYGLEGYTAVINVKLKKNYTGQELFIETMSAFDFNTPDINYLMPINEFNLDYNYTRKSLNIYSSFWGESTSFGLFQDIKRVYNDGLIITQTNQNNERNFKMKNVSSGLMLGVDYQFDSVHTLSFEGSADVTPKNKTNNHYLIKNIISDSVLSSEIYNFSSSNSSTIFSGTVFYRGEFSKNKQLNTSFSYSKNRSEGLSNYTFLRKSTINDSKDYTNSFNTNLEWTQSLNKRISYQMGYGNTWNKSYNNFKTNTDLTLQKISQIDFRNRGFLYGTYKISKALHTKTGIAIENSFSKLGNQQKEYWIYKPYFDLFYKPTDLLNFKLKYRRNVNYPDLTQTNPLKIRLDNFIVQIGNPNLKPSTVHKTSLKMNIMDGLFFTEVFYHFSNDYISPIGSLNNEGLLEYSYANLGGYEHKGVRLNFVIPFSENIIWENSATIFNSRMTYQNFTNSFTDWSGESQLMYMNEKRGLFMGVMMQKSNVKVISLQGYKQNDNDFWGFMVQKSFFKEKGNMMLMYMMPIDLVVDYTQNTHLKTPFYTENNTVNFNLIKNIIMIELSYRFQKGKEIKESENRKPKKSKSFL
jgi:hypothetical protein